MHAPVSPVAGLSQGFGAAHLSDASAGTAMRVATRMVFNITAPDTLWQGRVRMHTMCGINKQQLEPKRIWSFSFKHNYYTCKPHITLKCDTVRSGMGPLWGGFLNLERPRERLIKWWNMPTTHVKLWVNLLSKPTTGAPNGDKKELPVSG